MDKEFAEAFKEELEKEASTYRDRQDDDEKKKKKHFAFGGKKKSRHGESGYGKGEEMDREFAEAFKEEIEKEASTYTDKARDDEKKKKKHFAFGGKKKSRHGQSGYGKGEEVEATRMPMSAPFKLVEMKWEVGVVYHQEYKNGDRTYFRADSVQKNTRWKGMSVDEIGGKQKKPKNNTADEKVQGWETTPKNEIPKGLKEGLSSFSTYITEGRSKASADDYAATPKDLARHKNLLKGLIDAQRKHYTEREIQSIARKYKQNVATAEGGKDFEDWDGEWIITLMNSIELTYDYNSNTTTIRKCKFDKKKAEIHLAKYGSEHETVRDMKPVSGKVKVGGFEAAFELMFGRVGRGMFEEVELDEAAHANSVAGGNVNLDPFVKKKRKNAKVQTEIFGGQKVFVVSPQRYFDSRLGKARYARYEKYVGNDKLGETIRQYARNNPKNSIILKNSGNGAMLYLKYGRN